LSKRSELGPGTKITEDNLEDSLMILSVKIEVEGLEKYSNSDSKKKNVENKERD